MLLASAAAAVPAHGDRDESLHANAADVLLLNTGANDVTTAHTPQPMRRQLAQVRTAHMQSDDSCRTRVEGGWVGGGVGGRGRVWGSRAWWVGAVSVPE